MPDSTIVNAAIPIDLNHAGVPSFVELGEQISSRREGFDVTKLFFVTLTRESEQLTLVLDAGWVRLLQDTDVAAPDVVPSMGIPTTALAAILPCWPDEFSWVNPVHCHWSQRDDGVLIAHVDHHTDLSSGAEPR